MCLVSETNIPSIATEDIVCYKILVSVNGQLLTPYRDFIFEIGKLYTDSNREITFPFNNVYFVESGFFHAFTEIREPVKDMLQSMLKRQYPKEDRQVKMFKAIIPKGSLYFKGNDKDICSKSMKIIDEI